MLSTPKYGWVNITIGDWTDRCSDISGNVPVMLLSAMDYVLTYKLPKVVEFDAEGWEYYIIFNTNETVVVSNKFGDFAEGSKTNYLVYDYGISIYDVAKEIVNDVWRNIDEWATWRVYNSNESTCLKNKNTIEELCSNLEMVFLGKVE